jgi:hypothetical protein
MTAARTNKRQRRGRRSKAAAAEGRKEGRKPAPQPLEDMNFQTVRNYG